MTERTTRNVLFVRWSDDESTIKGIHIEERWAYLDANGAEQASKMLPARPIAPGDADALAAIASSINAAALADNDAKAAQIAQMTADHATALNQAAADLATAIGERDAARGDAQALTTQLAAFQSSVDANGVPAWVDAVQGEKQLIIDGKMARVQEVLAAMPGTDGELARVDFARAPRWHRSSYMVAAMIAAGVYTSTEADAAFVAAVKL